MFFEMEFQEASEEFQGIPEKFQGQFRWTFRSFWVFHGDSTYVSEEGGGAVNRDLGKFRGFSEFRSC